MPGFRSWITKPIIIDHFTTQATLTSQYKINQMIWIPDHLNSGIPTVMRLLSGQVTSCICWAGFIQISCLLLLWSVYRTSLIQQPSEYRTIPVFKWSKHVQLSNGQVFEQWSENQTKMSNSWSTMSSPVTIWIPNKAGIQIVQICSDFQMVVWKLDKKCLFYGLKYPVFKWST